MARRAPAFIWTPRPRGEEITCVFPHGNTSFQMPAHVSVPL